MDTKKDIDIIVGDKVEVKEGTMCPDFEGLDIGGWEGSITEVDNDGESKALILIEWDDKTLKNMPDYFIQQSEDEGLEHKLMYLYPEDVRLIE